ncbi:hypothetical protein ACEF00_02245 [Streptococcus hyovaginalis]
MAIIIFLSVFAWSYQALYTYWKKELKDKKNKRATALPPQNETQEKHSC